MSFPLILITIYYLIIILTVIVAVSFYTLYERKIMGKAHLRQGPQIVGWDGLLQPFADAIKLFTKERCPPLTSNYLIYFIRPCIIITISILVWIIPPFSLN